MFTLALALSSVVDPSTYRAKSRLVGKSKAAVTSPLVTLSKLTVYFLSFSLNNTMKAREQTTNKLYLVTEVRKTKQ